MSGCCSDETPGCRVNGDYDEPRCIGSSDGVSLTYRRRFRNGREITPTGFRITYKGQPVEFAASPGPLPEPRLFGAVVEDSYGTLWLRFQPEMVNGTVWRCQDPRMEPREWSAISAVRVVRESAAS